MPPTVSVILPSRGRFQPLLDTLDDLLAQTYTPFDVHVIDQNAAWPADLGERRAAVRTDPRVHWTDAFPPGVVRARNHAAASSRGDLLLFVDDDVWIPDRDFIARHVAAYADPTVIAVCGRELKRAQVDASLARPLAAATGVTKAAPDMPAFAQLLAFDRSQADDAWGPALSTCNCSIRRDAFTAVGGFDEQFRGASYGDDADLALRLWAYRPRIRYVASAWLVHLLAPAGGLRLSDPNNPFDDHDKVLSGCIVLFRHAGRREFWPVLRGWVLRRSLLLRRNVVRPWRLPRVVLALVRALVAGRRAARRPPRALRSS